MANLFRAIAALLLFCLANSASAQITDRRVTGMVLWVYDDGSFHVADVSELPLGEAAAQGRRVHQFLWNGVSKAAVEEYLIGRIVSCDIVHQIAELNYISADCSRRGPTEIRQSDGFRPVMEICESTPDADCRFAGNLMAGGLSGVSLECSDIDYDNRHNFNEGIFGIPLDRNDPNHQFDRICEESRRG